MPVGSVVVGFAQAQKGMFERVRGARYGVRAAPWGVSSLGVISGGPSGPALGGSGAPGAMAGAEMAPPQLPQLQLPQVSQQSQQSQHFGFLHFSISRL